MPNSLTANLIFESIFKDKLLHNRNTHYKMEFIYVRTDNRFNLCLDTWRTLMSEDCQSTSFDTTWFTVEQHFQDIIINQ